MKMKAAPTQDISRQKARDVNRNWLWALALVFLFSARAQAATNIDPTNKYSWGANVGWMNWAPDSVNGAVMAAFCSGYVYSANVGWIFLGDGTPDNGLAYSNARPTDYGINIDTKSDPNNWLLSGLAYSANVGWINFSVLTQTGAANRPRIDRTTGKMLGYAWSANAGWLPLDSSPTAQLVVTLPPPQNAAKQWMLYQ